MDQVSLVIILLAALLIPLIMAKFKINSLPTAVMEIIIGIILGPSVFNFVNTSDLISQLSTIGVIVLLFLSGLEIDFSLFKKRRTELTPLEQKNAVNTPKYSPVRLSVYAYGTIVVLSLGLAAAFKASGLFSDFWLATILFGTISLGIVIAALKEQELLSKAFGQTVLLISVFGELVPMMGLTLYASVYGSNSQSLWLLLLILAVAALLLLRFKPFFRFYQNINKSTTQLDIRLAFFLIVTMVTVAESVGAENILGAFVAGIVLKLLNPSETTRERLDAIGYGFFIPIFFITTGVDLNLRTLLTSGKTLLLIPLFFLAYMIAKIGGFWILKLRFKQANALAGTALTATTMTMVLAVLRVAKSMKTITTDQSGAFLLAALLTCIVSPLIFNKLYSAEKEDLVKTSVHFIGANLSTVPVAQQLRKGWYDVAMYTNHPENYQTYHAQVPVTLMENFSAQDLQDHGVFDTDILILGHIDAERNYELAKAAKSYGVRRIIVRFEDRNVLNEHEDELRELGVEVYNTPEANITLLRALIESPSTLLLLNDTENSIYEVRVLNHRYTNVQIKNLQFAEDVTISQVIRNRKLIAPNGNTTIMYGDRLIFTSNKQSAAQIRQALSTAN
ncbi:MULTISPECIES: monovalent cation:proton antiporter family protein [Lactiplantibacillus]|uniref:Na(+)/H(+) antiporter n=1 Tax=Lactiplantibacillus pentosus IG1 TaxID=1042160 RepID=G0M2J9_LACPE|nr:MULTISPECIES: cation:proton antiporter family protein [Lactiplantibacillus]CCC16300.1 Na(+)/H(+) antiporter [Lactiplantibacillus pentosus IG1]ASG79084.1 potassium transporter [Lactiplantibacillus pentosus]AYG36669.1 potassium transporter [Lactiplantibacillus pentosus]AYG42297.1 potassium transporter [Lactiplantibacillus pentosus]MBU7448874.1 monovalent cation:proton antiporter family protein [Lactiplantibacillus sp. 7.2.4]